MLGHGKEVRKMADKEKEAFWGGYRDCQKSGGKVNSNPITEVFHSSYNPPEKHAEAYKAGWGKAKQDKK
jgi:hypothetical protein